MSLKQPLMIYLQTSNISRTLAGNIIVDYSDVDRLSALLELHLHSQLNPWFQLSGQRQLQDETRIILVLGFGASNIRDFTVTIMHADNTMYSGTRNPLRNTCRIDYYEVLSIIEILIKFWPSYLHNVIAHTGNTASLRFNWYRLYMYIP